MLRGFISSLPPPPRKTRNTKIRVITFMVLITLPPVVELDAISAESRRSEIIITEKFMSVPLPFLHEKSFALTPRGTFVRRIIKRLPINHRSAVKMFQQQFLQEAVICAKLLPKSYGAASVEVSMQTRLKPLFKLIITSYTSFHVSRSLFGKYEEDEGYKKLFI